MKLRNKKTGEIRNVADVVIENLKKNGSTLDAISIDEIRDEWEDYEEPKRFYWVDYDGKICNAEIGTMDRSRIKQIGNYFDTREEAEKAVEKLKAWERLKDEGFRFTLTPVVGSLDVTPDKFQIEINADMPAKWFCCDAVQKDLEVCFGGEE